MKWIQVNVPCACDLSIKLETRQGLIYLWYIITLYCTFEFFSLYNSCDYIDVEYPFHNIFYLEQHNIHHLTFYYKPKNIRVLVKLA